MLKAMEVDGVAQGRHGRARREPARLSGGQGRRLSVAQGVPRRPEVLLRRATEGLDSGTGARLLAGVRAAVPAAVS